MTDQQTGWEKRARIMMRLVLDRIMELTTFVQLVRVALNDHDHEGYYEALLFLSSEESEP